MTFQFFALQPLACKVATAAIEVLRDEKLAENSAVRGEQLRAGLNSLTGSTCIESVRGRGLLNAIVIDQKAAESRLIIASMCVQ